MRLTGRDWGLVALYMMAGLAVMVLFWALGCRWLISQLNNFAFFPRRSFGPPWICVISFAYGGVPLLLPFALSGHLILALGPKGSLGPGSLWLLVFLVSMIETCFHPAVLTRAPVSAGDFWKVTLGFTFPFSWCLTWAIDVVRRRKLAQEVAS